MKTSELQPPELDYWVARAEGWILDIENDDWIFHTEAIIGAKFYKPSTDWSQGGPIIEREQIDLAFCVDGSCSAEMDVTNDDGTGWTTGKNGPTPLIAAMRAYVASKFGEEVEEV